MHLLVLEGIGYQSHGHSAILGFDCERNLCACMKIKLVFAAIPAQVALAMMF